MRLLQQLLLAGLRLAGSLVLIFVFSFFVVITHLPAWSDELWTKLGLQQDQANLNIKFSLLNGGLQYHGAKKAPAIPENERVAIVNQLVAYAKKYVSSREFIDQYKKEREKRKPAEPQLLPVDVATIKAEEKARLEKALKAAEEGLNSTNPKIKNGAPARIENVKKELAGLDDPNNKRIKSRLDQLQRMNDAVLKKYSEDLKKYNENFPEDPGLLVKKRLQEILNITADVDYAAELRQGANGKKYFVKPEYEKKPNGWKLAYRAGKAATDAARAAAEKWLKELQ